MDFEVKKIEKTLSVLKGRMIAECTPVKEFLFKSCPYRTSGEIPVPDGSYTRFLPGMHWADTPDSHAWFFASVTVPKMPEGCYASLVIETDLDGWNVYNPQFICYINGNECQSFDTNHRSMPLDTEGEIQLAVYAYSGSLGKNIPFICRVESVSACTEKLYYDMLLLLEMLEITNESDKAYADIRKALTDACDLLDLRKGTDSRFFKTVESAQRVIDAFTSKKSSHSSTVVCVGHSHIDVAWMWTLSQTREKICRTVSTVLSLMERYPDFVFMESQAQLYKYLKEEAPALYEKVKQRVAEGRWEVEGAMWVEADCNLTSGESLVRQINHGKRFFKQEFGVDSRILWLPDVFGYSAALPQICRKSGIDVFLTSKISWNDTDRMPYDAFIWRGLDGTGIFTYFLTAQDKVKGRESVNYTTYVATTDPKCVSGCAERFTQKELTDETLLTFGWGDGGGGPTAKMLEKLARLEKNSLVCPAVRTGKAADFLLSLKERCENDKRLPEWVGELYLEYHRGTYTSVGEVKRNNRKAEFAVCMAELLCSVSNRLCGTDYPEEALYSAWETILLNQFHDILPGSSIKEVYLESEQQFEALFAKLDDITAGAVKEICRNIATDGGILVFNPHSFTAGGDIRLDGKCYHVDGIPAKGYSVIKPEKRTPLTISGNGFIENDYYRLEFAPDYSIKRLYDKRCKREVLSGVGNRLVAYEDIPFNYSCWNIEEYHKAKPYVVNEVLEAESARDGERSGYRITYKFMSSVITQYVWLYDFSPRIDFVTHVDWKEEDLLLKAEFDVVVKAQSAVYDVQFGQASRPTHTNTSWDKAKFEVCGQKYADLSDHGYGVALLNDCKYGYDVHGSKMCLSLIKCSSYVNEYYDKAEHDFTYSLLPHEGDYREAGVINEAYLLNDPLIAIPIRKRDGSLPEKFSFITFSQPNIVCESIKKAYDGRGYIVRAFESFDMNTLNEFKLCGKATEVFECDLLENDLSLVSKKCESFVVKFAPREIKTFRIILR